MRQESQAQKEAFAPKQEYDREGYFLSCKTEKDPSKQRKELLTLCKLSSSRLTVYWLYTRWHGPGVLITSKRASHRVLEKKGTIEKKAMRLKPEKKLFCQQAGAYTSTLLTAFYSPVLYY